MTPCTSRRSPRTYRKPVRASPAVGAHRFRATHRAVTARDIIGNGAVIDDDPVQKLSSGVRFNGAHVIGQCEFLGFSGLRHQIRDIDASGARFLYRLGHAGY